MYAKKKPNSESFKNIFYKMCLEMMYLIYVYMCV